MTEREFAELLGRGYESRGVEFKGPGARNTAEYTARVVRAALGMANLRDGGLIILGVVERGDTLASVGLSDADLATWSYDDTAQSFGEYAQPSLRFDLEVLAVEARRHVIIRVKEFDEIPILCARSFTPTSGEILRRGACYVRGRRKPETSEIPSQDEMRELIELATEKGLRRFFAQAHAAGVDLSAVAAVALTDAERFAEQLRTIR